MPGISEEALRRRLTLDQSETVLRRLLREVDWPFLGLFGEELNTTMHAAVLDSINLNPSVGGFVRHLELYPALSSIFLCRVLMQTFGQTDHFQLWPEIRKALRLNRPLNTVEQDELWLAFRSACVWMGLEVSPRTSGTHYRVDEFLRQVGLSVAFSGDLAKKMLSFARRNGLPDEDEARTLARSAALCWIGLKTFRDGLRFICDSRPANLFEAGSDNFQASDKEVGCRDVSRRTMRLVFELDSRREVALTWSVPGVFLDLLEYDDQGLVIRKPLVVGSTLLASVKSSQQLAVSSHERATLQLGTFSRRIDFTTRGSITLPIGTLADAITSESAHLEYLPEGKPTGIILLRLIKPHEVLSFETRLEPGRLILRFATGNRIEAVQIRAQELVSGAEQTILADSSIPGGNHYRASTAQMLITRRDDGAFSTTVLLDASSFRTGAWVLGVEVLAGGSWGRLTNPRGDHYAAGMIISENGRISNGNSVTAFLADLRPSVLHTVLGRFHNAFQYCYAEPCWQNMQWIDSGWRTLIDRCFEQGNENFGTLLKLVASPMPESTAPSWIPQLTVLSRKPAILALGATTYSVIANENHPLTKSLSAIAALPNNLAHAFQGLIHVSVAFSFRNASKIEQVGEHPNGFDAMRFKEALRQTDDRAANYLVGDEHFLPAEGHMAGPLHYRFAKISLEENFARTLGGNAVRRGQALGLAREAERLYSRVQLAGRSVDSVVDPWPMETDESTPDSIAQKVSTFRGLERFISVFAWHCRLEPRQPGVLNQFLDRAHPPGVEPSAPLGYILHIGNALLGFYLLLWEIVLRSDLDKAPHAR